MVVEVFCGDCAAMGTRLRRVVSHVCKGDEKKEEVSHLPFFLLYFDLRLLYTLVYSPGNLNILTHIPIHEIHLASIYELSL